MNIIDVGNVAVLLERGLGPDQATAIADQWRTKCAEVEMLRKMLEKSMQSNALNRKALQECQKLLCPEFGDCAETLKDGEKCACGFEDGPFANAVPKNCAAISSGERTDG